MAVHPDANDPELRSEDDLFTVFSGAYRPTPRLVGIECERVGIFSDGRPLHFHDDAEHPGVQSIFALLTERFGWQPEAAASGPPLSLLRDGASITLEPGSQFELSGAPHASLHDLAAELTAHRDELLAVRDALGVNMLGLGFHPYARQDDLDWVPKGRYPIMREYLPTRGANGLDMMRRTATVQANYDLPVEAEVMRRTRAALALSPVVTALFANSATVEGVRRPFKSRRAEVWLDVDNARAGLLPFAWRDGASVGDYARWALDVPMFIVKRGDAVRRATHLTFRDFMRDGFEGERATLSDWETHLKTLFPEVRLARTIEVRGADTAPLAYAAALPALWLPVLYDAQCLAAVESLVVPYGYDAWQAVRPAAAAQGLAATIGATTLADIARRVIDEATRALVRRGVRDADGRDESRWIEPLAALAADGRSVGDAVLGDWSPSQPDAVASLIARALF